MSIVKNFLSTATWRSIDADLENSSSAFAWKASKTRRITILQMFMVVRFFASVNNTQMTATKRQQSCENRSVYHHDDQLLLPPNFWQAGSATLIFSDLPIIIIVRAKTPNAKSNLLRTRKERCNDAITSTIPSIMLLSFSAHNSARSVESLLFYTMSARL